MEPVFIESLGVHVPRYRLDAEEAARFWGARRPPGRRAVANWDEDPVTMSVTAGRVCLDRAGAVAVDAVLLASTTLPYAEKQCAALVAEALDLPQDVDTFDVTSSLRAGMQAVRLAADRVRATGQRVLVVAADLRVAAPDTPAEITGGDAAAAILLGPSGPVEVGWVASRYATWLSHWRLADERYGQDADSRFVAQRTQQSLEAMIEAAAKTAADGAAGLAAVAAATPVPQAFRRAVRAGNVPDDVAVHGPDLQGEIGYAGVAGPFLSLAAALEQAGPGDAVAWIGDGDGAEAAVVRVGVAQPFGSELAGARDGGRALTYGGFLRLRKIVGDIPTSPFSSEIAQAREATHTARLRGLRCSTCDTVAYPPQPVCTTCGHDGDMEAVPLAQTGRLFTFTVEHLYPNAERRLAMGVVDLDGGGRFYGPIADAAPEELEVGMRLRLVYRRLHLGGGFVNYFWKATPDKEAAHA